MGLGFWGSMTQGFDRGLGIGIRDYERRSEKKERDEVDYTEK